MLTFEDVKKQYGSLMALDGLSFEARPGEVLGLLGPNGAGKSTTVHLALGLLSPDSGRVLVDGGHSPARPEVRRRIGAAPQALAIYELLTATENLRFFGQVYGLSGSRLAARVEACLDFVGLRDRAGARVATFSGGMKRRLNLAAALVHDPAILLVDEPTVGVDPQSRNLIIENIRALRADQRTIVYTTHYMEEAERLCDQLAIVDHGRLLAFGSVPDLLAEHGGTPTLVVETAKGSQRLQAPDPLAALNQIAATEPVLGFHVERASLEQVFLSLTGRSLRE